jgi:hypothetical protein
MIFNDVQDTSPIGHGMPLKLSLSLSLGLSMFRPVLGL